MVRLSSGLFTFSLSCIIISCPKIYLIAMLQHKKIVRGFRVICTELGILSLVKTAPVT